MNVPPDHCNVGFINSFQGFPDTVNRLLKVNCPIWIIIGRNYDINRGICSKVSSVTGTGKLDLNDLEETAGLKETFPLGSCFQSSLVDFLPQ